MRVILFCGGLGTRLRGHESNKPKPLIEIGGYSLLRHIMRYYAFHGHSDFILCLGYRADAIIDHFRELGGEWLPTNGGAQPARSIRFMDNATGGWTITFVETGANTCIGQRLKLVQPYLQDDEFFLANYADGLSDVPLADIVDMMAENPLAVGTMIAVKPNQSFHYVCRGAGGFVSGITSSTAIDARINGGYFVFRKSIFDYIEPGEDLVDEPFRRLIDQRRLMAYDYDGFWRACDTLKDVQELEALIARTGAAPWEVWRTQTVAEAVPMPIMRYM